jgi:hypothetical protein
MLPTVAALSPLSARPRSRGLIGGKRRIRAPRHVGRASDCRSQAIRSRRCSPFAGDAEKVDDEQLSGHRVRGHSDRTGCPREARRSRYRPWLRPSHRASSRREPQPSPPRYPGSRHDPDGWRRETDRHSIGADRLPIATDHTSIRPDRMAKPPFAPRAGRMPTLSYLLVPRCVDRGPRKAPSCLPSDINAPRHRAERRGG